MMNRITNFFFLFLCLYIGSCNIKKPLYYYEPVCRFDVYVETYGQQVGNIKYFLSETEKHYLMRFDSIGISDKFIALSKVNNGLSTPCFSIKNIEDTIVFEINLEDAQHSYIQNSGINVGAIMLCDFHISEPFFETSDTIVLQAKYEKQSYDCIYGFRCCGVSDCDGTIIKTMNSNSTKQYVRTHDFIKAPPNIIIKYEVFNDSKYYKTVFIIKNE